MSTITNAEIDVNAFYFAGKDMKSFPRRISFGNQAVTFADGLRVAVQRGSEFTYLFDMLATDGGTYRLRQQGNQWTLLEAR
jgi:hypothetical protein